MNKSITTSGKSPRSSNMELLRFLAMMLVLAVHANYLSLGDVTALDLRESPTQSIVRLLFEGISLMCVNVFILISGWFSIKPKISGISKFLFQCLYFTIVGIALAFISGSQIGVKQLICVLFFTKGAYWFIPAYLGLFIVSPILNRFIESSTKREFGIIVASLLLFQSIYGFLFMNDLIHSGYSIISFIILYLLGGYARRYLQDTSIRLLSAVFIISLLLNCFIGISGQDGSYRFWAYSNPILIMQSLAVLLLFSKIKIKSNRFINLVAASSFAAYLFHCHPLLMNRYLDACRWIYNEYSGVAYLVTIILFMIAIYAIAFTFDQLRKFFWNMIIYYTPSKYSDIISSASVTSQYNNK